MLAAGVFVGVSHQTDERIDALRFAARDAEALWAALADANEASGHPPEPAVLLTNTGATTRSVGQALDRLAQISGDHPFDFVHIHFSCHGTPDGRLALFDAVWGDYDATCLPLAEITRRLTTVRSSLSMLTFDSCFSGTVVGVEDSPNAAAFEAVLQRMANETRAVAWAAAPAERAWESPRFSHGYFSYGLIRGLQDARAAGRARIDIAAWLQGALNFTATQTRAAGRIQNPQARIALAAGADIPMMPDGPRQQRRRAEAGIRPVGQDLEDLRACGLGTGAIAALRGRLQPGGRLNALQRQAISPGGVLAGRNIVVRAPTSAGKTVVGELAVLAQLEQGRKGVVLLPTRALVHEQADRFARHYAGMGYRIVRSAGDAGEQDALLFGQHFDVAFLTYEKFSALAVARPGILAAVGCAVVDELQQISDPTRGAVVELILTRLMHHRRRTGQRLQIVGLCANITDLNRLPEWLEAEQVGDGSRPVPLHEITVAPSGRRLKRTDREAGPIEERVGLEVDLTGLPYRDREHALRARLACTLIRHLVSEGAQVLAFCGTKYAVRKLAGALAGAMQLNPANRTLEELARWAPVEADRSRAHAQLRDVLARGVGFHIADLERVEREAVEGGFRSGEIGVLVATTTLAMGVNTPANAVVIVDAELPSGERGAMEPVDVTTYRNMAGRAGRLGHVAEGHAYLLAESDAAADGLWRQYVDSDSERLDSALELSADADLVLALAALVGRATITDLVSMAQRTYLGYLRRTDEAWWSDRRACLRRAAEELVRDGYLTTAEEPEYTLSEVGRVCGVFGLRVESARRLLAVIDAMTATGAAVGEGEIVALAQVTAELDGMYTPLATGEEHQWTNARNGWLEARPMIAAALRAGSDDRLAGARLKRFAGLRLWIAGEPIHRIEEVYDARPDFPSLGTVRRVAERTADVVPPVAGLVAIRQPHRRGELRELVTALRWRLEHGASVAASRLRRVDGALSRHQANELVRNGVESEEQLLLTLERQDPNVFGVLTTPVAHELHQRLRARARQAGARIPRRDQQILDLFGENDEL